ncbi:MAG: acyl-CoA thioesterase [Deltaproteobacteria bacterium]|nr:acyl-CoA thioesterase [Deltaproteobacteria bacterium]
MASVAPLLARWPVVLELPVQWGEMDELGHVNNVIYLRWFETARMEYFRRAHLWDRVRTEGIGPILARSTIDYRLALSFPDDVRVAATVLKLGNTSITMGMRLRSRKHDRAIAAEGEAVLVMVEYATGRKVPLTPEMIAAIESLEATAADGGDQKADA